MTAASDFEWGRLVAVVDTLTKEIGKLDLKLDGYIKDQVNRREFDALEERLKGIEVDIKHVKSKQDSDGWIGKLVAALISAAISTGIAILFV